MPWILFFDIMRLIKTMEEKRTAEIIENLLKEEEAENVLISLYILLLDLGIQNCLSEDQRDGFRNSMNILYKESLKHKQFIEDIFNNYKNNPL